MALSRLITFSFLLAKLKPLIRYYIFLHPGVKWANSHLNVIGFIHTKKQATLLTCSFSHIHYFNTVGAPSGDLCCCPKIFKKCKWALLLCNLCFRVSIQHWVKTVSPGIAFCFDSKIVNYFSHKVTRPIASTLTSRWLMQVFSQALIHVEVSLSPSLLRSLF